MVKLAPTSSQIYFATPLIESIFAPPPDTRNAFVRFFEDNWRTIVSVLEFIASVALIPFTGGLSVAAATAIQVGADIVFGALDTVLDVVVEKREFTGLELLNFLPLGISAAGKGVKLIAKGLVKAGVFGAAKVGKDVAEITSNVIRAGDFKDLNIKVILRQRVPTLNKFGIVSFDIDANVVRRAGANASDKHIMLTAFREQVYSAESYATSFGKKQVLDKGSFWYMSNVLEDEIARSADDYTRQISKLRSAISDAEKAYARATARGLNATLDKASQALFNAEFKVAAAKIIKYYKLLKKTIARIKWIFEIPSKIVRFVIQKSVKILRKIPIVDKFAKKFGKNPFVIKATKVKDGLLKAANRGGATLRALDMIPVESRWIAGVKIRPKFTAQQGTIGNLVRIAEIGQIPNDPTWYCDMFIIFKPATTSHDGRSFGRPHQRWGIVGPGEPNGKRPVKIYMNGSQLNDLLNNYTSFGNWYLTIGRNMARETTIAEIVGAVAAAGGMVGAGAGSQVGRIIANSAKVFNLGLKTLREAMYWRAQAQFVYARILQIQNGTFFERMYNPNKLKNLAIKTFVSSVFKGNSFGNMAYRFGYALANNNAKGIAFLAEKNIRSINRHHSAELKRVRGLINTGRKISSPNFTKLIKPVKVRPPSSKR